MLVSGISFGHFLFNVKSIEIYIVFSLPRYACVYIIKVHQSLISASQKANKTRSAKCQ